MRIALDAMGGDHGPAPNVAGAVLALSAVPDLSVVLVGDRAALDPLLAAAGSVPAGRLAGGRASRRELADAWQSVNIRQTPVEAPRRKPDSSIVRSWQLLAEKMVDGLVSAGNTGAVVAGGMWMRKFLRSVHRPGIAAVMPTAKGNCVIMDVGANVFPRPRHL